MFMCRSSLRRGLWGAAERARWVVPGKMSTVRVVFVILIAGVQWSACRAKRCLDPVPCCSDCNQAPRADKQCECAQGETPAFLCPKRSTCALSYFVGEGPARCCPSCASSDAYHQASACEAQAVYLHECPVESACVQSHRAASMQADFVPFSAAVGVAVGGALTDIWAGEQDLWLVGRGGRVLHRREGTFSTVNAGSTEDLRGVWGRGPQALWVVGRNGTLLHYDGSRWQQELVPVKDHLNAIWGTDTEIWAVGAAGVILRKASDGPWLQLSSPVAKQLLAVSGDASGVWIAGEAGTLLRADNDAELVGVRAVPSPTSAHLSDIWVDEGAVAWAVGEAGVLLRFDGIWHQEHRLGDGRHLFAIDGGPGELWAAGGSGLIMRQRGETWRTISYFRSEATPDLFSVRVTSQGVWAVGELGAALYYAR